MNPQMLKMMQQQMAGQDNEALQQLMQQWLAQKQQASEEERPNPTLLRLRQANQRWRLRCEDLAQRVRFFAELFGACPVCFGEDGRCPHCQGQGHLGAYESDTELLVELVAPLLSQAGLTIIQADPSATSSSKTGEREDA